MKDNYESRQTYFLTRRIPVIIRIDGQAFHTYTSGLKKPFDDGLIEDMNQTAMYLCQKIQGAKCAYVQSDEISILVTDYDTVDTDAWFNYNKSKVESISAGLAAGKFNQLRLSRYLSQIWDTDADNEDILNLFSSNIDTISIANFDSRATNYPKEEVANYFLARQNDCVKNSIASVAQSLYPHKELEGKNQSQQQELIFQKGINWNDFDSGLKRGRFIVKNTYVNDELLSKGFEVIDGKLEFQGLPSQEQMNLLNSNYTLRSKWEVVETPMKFTYKDFEKWL